MDYCFGVYVVLSGVPSDHEGRQMYVHKDARLATASMLLMDKPRVKTAVCEDCLKAWQSDVLIGTDHFDFITDVPRKR